MEIPYVNIKYLVRIFYEPQNTYSNIQIEKPQDRSQRSNEDRTHTLDAF